MRIKAKLVELLLLALPLKYFYKLKLFALFLFEPNPLINKYHGKYSQNEEDDILENIIKKIGAIPKIFIEFGIGNGFQNNTLNLIQQNWHGVWIGNEELTITKDVLKNVNYIREQVTLEKISKICEQIKIDKIGVLSVDLDGNDWHFANYLLTIKRLNPEIFVIEHNSSYNKNSEYIMDYNATHVWDGSDNFGASLSSYKILFKKFDYFLCAVNLTGVNAFFIKNYYKGEFDWQIENPDKIFRKQFKYYKEYRRPIDYTKINFQLENN